MDDHEERLSEQVSALPLPSVYGTVQNLSLSLSLLRAGDQNAGGDHPGVRVLLDALPGHQRGAGLRVPGRAAAWPGQARQAWIHPHGLPEQRPQPDRLRLHEQELQGELLQVCLLLRAEGQQAPEAPPPPPPPS